MPKVQERRTDRASADDVAEIERQLWQFAKRITPPGVPEAKLRPGAFLYRVHRIWHSLGRGTGGLASRSFRALRDELLTRDPPVRNLQPKLYGNTALSLSEAEQLTDVMLATWHLDRNRSGKWQARPILHPDTGRPAESQDIEAIRENLLHTLFKGDDQLLLEEPVGVPPEVFFEERGRSSLALILPTKSETVAHLSPSNAYGGFSSGLENFFNAAAERLANREKAPLLIWVLRLGAIRDNAEFHQAFHALALHSACLTNWYFRLSRKHGTEAKQADDYWKMIIQHSAFIVHGLPSWLRPTNIAKEKYQAVIDEELSDLDPNFLLPDQLPIVLGNHRQVKRHRDHDFGLTVSIERPMEGTGSEISSLSYWLFPDEPKSDLTETAETTGLPVFGADISPGDDFDRAYEAVYSAVMYKLGFSDDEHSQRCLATLSRMGWTVKTIRQFQEIFLVSESLASDQKN